ASVEGPSNDRLRPEHSEEAGRDARALQAFGLACAGQVGGPVDERREPVDRSRRALVVEQVGDGKRCSIALGAQVVHPDQAVWISEREPVAENAIDQRKHRRCGADAEPENSDRKGAQAEVAPQEPHWRADDFQHLCDRNIYYIYMKLIFLLKRTRRNPELTDHHGAAEKRGTNGGAVPVTRFARPAERPASPAWRSLRLTSVPPFLRFSVSIRYLRPPPFPRR